MAAPAELFTGGTKKAAVRTLDERLEVVEDIASASRLDIQGSENENADPAQQEPVQPASPAFLTSEPDRESEGNDPEQDEKQDLLSGHPCPPIGAINGRSLRFWPN
jgi:hypothetical protein